MAISTIALFNTGGVNTSSAVLGAGGTKDTSVTQSQAPASSIVRISARGHALMSLDSLQAAAEAIKNSNVPPTLTDFKVLVNGVVSSLNAIRKSAAAVATSQSTLANTVRKRQGAIDEFSGKNKASATALQGIGVTRQGGGEFSVHSKQLVKSFNSDGKGAFATLTEFVKKISSDSAEDDSVRGVRDSENTKGHGKDKNKRASDVTEKSGDQAALRGNVDLQPNMAGSLAVKSAVTAYSTVASL